MLHFLSRRWFMKAMMLMPELLAVAPPLADIAYTIRRCFAAAILRRCLSLALLPDAFHYAIWCRLAADAAWHFHTMPPMPSPLRQPWWCWCHDEMLMFAADDASDAAMTFDYFRLRLLPIYAAMMLPSFHADTMMPPPFSYAMLRDFSDVID